MLRVGLGDQNHQIWVTGVAAHTPDGTPIDLSTSTLRFAFLPPQARPTAPDWRTGAWVGGQPSYTLTPLAIALAVGLWDVWLQITIGTVVIEVRVDILDVC